MLTRNLIATGILGNKPLSRRIADLFRAGEQGVWYDPSDFSTLFQNSAGATPVTAVEQPVGLILDKSKGLVLGAELVTNGGFDTDTTGWASSSYLTSTLANVSQRLEVTSVASAGRAVQPITLVIGKSYRFTAYAEKGTNLAAKIFIGTLATGVDAGVVTGTSVVTASSVAWSVVFVATAVNNWVVVGGNSTTGTNYFDNISVKELPGNRATQATSTARPTLRATPTRIDYDAVDDTLVATFAASLGTDCTVCRAVPSVGASILTAQTIGTSYTDSTDHCGLIIINRALTASETASVTTYLNQKAGV